MLIAIDIGNTSIQFGIIEKRKVSKVYEMKTVRTPRLLSRNISSILEKIMKRNRKVNGVIICSVVPKINKLLENKLKRDFKITPIIIGRDIIVPIKNKYKNPRQVGQDRLVGAFAACQLYGKPIIVVDLGTAITLDAISKRGEYLGGIIVPGIQLSADTLFKRAALIPKIKIQRPYALIGKDTETSILSGIFYGYGEMLRGLISLISKRFGQSAKVIVTGGYAHIMKKYIRKDIKKVDNHLVFKGMLFLWDQTI